jgi:hypothetical protein
MDQEVSGDPSTLQGAVAALRTAVDSVRLEEELS